MTLALRFVHQQHEAEDATSFFFQSDSALSFRAGQYLRYTLPHADPDGRGISRSFSIASFPDEPLLRLTTRLSTPPSTFKQALARLQPGALIEASGPFGQFVYTESDDPAIFIAGGIGITPIRSILGDLASRSLRIRSTLLYSSASQDIPFRPWLDGLSADWPELRVIYTVTRPTPEWKGLTGRIDAAFIKQHAPDVARSRYMLSGPTPLVEAMRATLADVGVNPDQLMYEAFPGYDR
jgi:ferredoxin-NADP reductase